MKAATIVALVLARTAYGTDQLEDLVPQAVSASTAYGILQLEDLVPQDVWRALIDRHLVEASYREGVVEPSMRITDAGYRVLVEALRHEAAGL